MTKSEEPRDFADVSDSQLKREMAVLQVLAKRVDAELKARKAAWLADPRHAQGDSDKVTADDGRLVAEVTITKDGADHLEVADPVAWGAVLKDLGATLAGGRKAWESAPVPRAEAREEKFIRLIVRQLAEDGQLEAGDLPDGITVRHGRAATVMVKPAKGVVDEPWTRESLGGAMRLLMPADQTKDEEE